jgi:hypothetical protein
MPNINDIISATKLGSRHRDLRIYIACPECGLERWVNLTASKTTKGLCPKCSRKVAQLRELDNTIKTSGGVIKHASELGFEGRSYHKNFPCGQCGKERWYKLSNVRADIVPKLCHTCAMKLVNRNGERGSNWQGGKGKTGKYIHITLMPDNPFYCMASKTCHRVMEHRLIMAQAIGRPLEKWEVVHHKNNNKTDNRFENLELLPYAIQNYAYYKIDSEIASLRERVRILEEENRLLNMRLGFVQVNRRANTGNEPEDCVETKRIAPTEKLGGDIVHPFTKV